MQSLRNRSWPAGFLHAVLSDHTDLRPAILSLAGLKDDDVHDGRVLVEDLERHVLPDSARDSYFTYIALAQAYKQLYATKGLPGVNSVAYANKAITSDDATYDEYLTTIGAITRNVTQWPGGLATRLKTWRNADLRRPGRCHGSVISSQRN